MGARVFEIDFLPAGLMPGVMLELCWSYAWSYAGLMPGVMLDLCPVSSADPTDTFKVL